MTDYKAAKIQSAYDGWETAVEARRVDLSRFISVAWEGQELHSPEKALDVEALELLGRLREAEVLAEAKYLELLRIWA